MFSLDGGMLMQPLTRERILDVALNLIMTDGLRRASLSEIARRLGVVKSALYHHFPDGKSEIVEQVFEREEQGILAEARRAIAAASGTRAQLAALARSTVVHIVRLARLYPVREEAADQIELYLEERRRTFLDREREQIAEVIGRGIETGEVRPVDVALAATALQGALRQIVRTFALRPGRSSAPVLTRVVDLTFDGIGGPR
jgi:AcrR family transcriptional regulator